MGDCGQSYVILIPAIDLYNLIPKYGGYAHGTIVKNGHITIDNMYGHGYEYTLRPNSIKRGTKSYELWTLLITNYSTTFEKIRILS